ncbi:hypothetical protein COU00_02900 [Candidatus Falkowbacteria bacterium CG10_big_fil_rev_8_21_14_0_10_43_11]|uniref:Uncharacterized protein n=1 Tax=Candidatus Falkowbacteria bacterium CG10_big_fil_rev_8_21_14_0_10_43_11 TaxID=1974568 RepID=A0A2M6WLN5_9BACT|nr:MAG: hypothetical protein COU00_02900 [Candidatus Falkowbacteria bacterium CG10_big_fil_rev_8_21_14_0_10_43_11]
MTAVKKSKLVHIYNNREMYSWGAMISFFISVCFGLIFLALILIVFFAQAKAVFFLRGVIQPIDIEAVIMFSLIFAIVFGWLVFWFFSRIQNYKIVSFEFLQKDFKPYIYYALCAVGKILKIFVAFEDSPLKVDERLEFNSLLEVSLKTTERLPEQMKELFVFPLLKIKIGFKNLVSSELLQIVFVDPESFRQKIKSELERILPHRLRNLGYNNSRVPQEKIEKACKKITLNIDGVKMNIARVYPIKPIPGQAEHFHPNNPLLKRKRKEQKCDIEDGLKKVLELQKKFELKKGDK